MADGRRRAWQLAAILAPLAVLALALACGDDDGGIPSPATNRPATTAARSGQPTASVAPANPSPSTQPAQCQPPSGTAPEPSMKKYDKKPDTIIDPAKSYTATVKTVRGDFTIKLRPDLAPQHVNSFVFLARDHFFDGVTFHRVLPGFVAQTGDPTGTGGGGPGYSIPLEPSAEPFVRGVLGMARGGEPNSAGSQWFVTLGDALFLNDLKMPLDKRYTVFGEVTQGMEVVDCITPRDPSRNPNAPAGDKIIAIEIQES